MSKIAQFAHELGDISAIGEALGHQLKEAQFTLDILLKRREKAIRLATGGHWDHEQYILDDLQQELGNVYEQLEDLSIIPAELQHFLAE